MRASLLVKIGGSIATRPDPRERVHRERVRAIGRVLAPHAAAGLAIVHGTGHVGKPSATRHGFASTGVLERERRAIALGIRADLRELNLAIVRELLDAGVPAISLCPADHLDVREPTGAPDADRLLRALEERLVPVFFGDMVLGEGGAFRVLSSDEIALRLAELLRPTIALFLTDVDGVFGPAKDGGERLLDVVREGTAIARRATDDADVSGGMSAKVETALRVARHADRCYILNGAHPERVSELLCGGGTVATRVESERTRDAP